MSQDLIDLFAPHSAGPSGDDRYAYPLRQLLDLSIHAWCLLYAVMPTNYDEEDNEWCKYLSSLREIGAALTFVLRDIGVWGSTNVTYSSNEARMRVVGASCARMAEAFYELGLDREHPVFLATMERALVVGRTVTPF